MKSAIAYRLFIAADNGLTRRGAITTFVPTTSGAHF